MNENLKLQLIQIVMLIIIMLRTLTPSVQCSVNAKEQMPMYVVKPITTSQMTQAQLNTALKDAPAIPSEYTVSESIAIYTQGLGDLVVIGVFAGIALYAAYNISQTQTSSSMTVSMPSLQLPSFGSWSGDGDFVTITYIREDESLPNQGLVDGGVAGGLPVDAGKQGKHVEGHNNEGTKKKSKWKEGMNGVKEIQEGWLRGDNIKDRTGKTGTIKEYDTGKVVGDDGKTTKIRVHKDGQTIEVFDSCIMR